MNTKRLLVGDKYEVLIENVDGSFSIPSSSRARDDDVFMIDMAIFTGRITLRPLGTTPNMSDLDEEEEEEESMKKSFFDAFKIHDKAANASPQRRRRGHSGEPDNKQVSFLPSGALGGGNDGLFGGGLFATDDEEDEDEEEDEEEESEKQRKWWQNLTSVRSEEEQDIEIGVECENVGSGEEHKGGVVGMYMGRPTKLHKACSQPVDLTVEGFYRVLLDSPEDVRAADQYGRLPIHVLSASLSMLSINAVPVWDRETVQIVATELIRQYPASMLHTDYSGNIPFVGLIHEWVRMVYEDHNAQAVDKSWAVARNATFLHRLGSGGMGFNQLPTLSSFFHASGGTSGEQQKKKPQQQQRSTSTFQSWIPGFSSAQSSKQYKSGKVVKDEADGKKEKFDFAAQAFSKALGDVAVDKTPAPTNYTAASSRTGSNDNGSIQASLGHMREPPKAEVTEEADFAFEMLSYTLDVFGGDHQVESTRVLSYEEQREQRDRLIAHVAPSPYLLQTIFLIEDDEDREKVLKTSIIRLAQLYPETVGRWILEMLGKRGLPATRAVDYFAELSSIKVTDYSGSFRTAIAEDKEAFLEQKNEVFKALEQISEIIPSLFVLEEKEIERAASTSVIWHVMSEGLARPFVIGVVLVDFVLHITLMLSFRAKVIASQQTEVVPTAVVQATTTFFLVRKAIECMALLKIGREVFRSYLTDVWNIFDTMAIVLTVMANSFNNPNFNALVLIMLWLKVLSFLKAINLQMATFILALIQILIDIRFFAFVLLVIIMMFGDAMHVIFTSTNDGEFCMEEDAGDNVEDFCSTSGASFYRMYGVLIGDFEISNYRQNAIVTAMFLIYTVFGVIMLLNVLIAVVSDSYEKSTMIGKDLFGRARVGFLSEQLTVESFLEPGSLHVSSKTTFCRKVGLLVFRLLRWAILFVMLGCAFFAEVYLVGRSVEILISSRLLAFSAILMVILAVVLTFALWVVIDFLFRAITRPLAERRPRVRRFYEANDRFVNYCIRFIRDRLFGPSIVTAEEEDGDEWAGRVNYLENKLTALLDKQEKTILTAIHNSEESIKEKEAALFAQQANAAALATASSTLSASPTQQGRDRRRPSLSTANALRNTRSFQRKTSYRRRR